ncbi:DUF4837 family protein [uncultured Polaribacter sp.]|uniref:DUF4837 family protein n=1 Tax=uncultured Polaribacter sp. TaxID=174711 RepID=UPI0026152D1B|nr:DUF4837 family protein [uncultured Polaribacter sp.]
MKKIVAICILFALLSACQGNDKFVLRGSIGTLNKVMVVTKASNWNGDLGTIIRNSFGELVVGLPQPEPVLKVSQIAPAGFNSMMKINRNILVIGTADKDEFYVKQNIYAKPQTIVYIYGKDNASAIAMFKKNEEKIIQTFLESEIKNTQNIFTNRRINNANYKTLNSLNIDFTIPDNFRTVEDTGNFLWLRQHLKSGIAKTGSNNILIYAIPLKDETKVAENIVAVRDSIGEAHIPGSDQETMHMITEEAYTPYTQETIVNGTKAFETRGKWEVKNDFMAGPFINYSVIDKKNNRVIVFEGFTYAPSVNKRAFLFELEAIGKSLKIN